MSLIAILSIIYLNIFKEKFLWIIQISSIFASKYSSLFCKLYMSSLEKSFIINANTKDVFDALTQEKWIKRWTGDVAEMDISPGGHFALWGGSIIGINRLVTENRIEQDWKEEQWPKFSQVVITLEEDEDGYTVLNLTHNNIPEKSLQAIDLGWDDYYLGPLKGVCENEFYTEDEFDEED